LRIFKKASKKLKKADLTNSTVIRDTEMFLDGKARNPLESNRLWRSGKAIKKLKKADLTPIAPSCPVVWGRDFGVQSCK